MSSMVPLTDEKNINILKAMADLQVLIKKKSPQRVKKLQSRDGDTAKMLRCDQRWAEDKRNGSVKETIHRCYRLGIIH